MADTKVVMKPANTAWGAVLGGWLATIGMSVILGPLAAGLITGAGSPLDPSDLALAVPAVLGLLLSYIVGGYVAGRMAGYRTSWHGMMTAFFTLFIVLVVLLTGALVDRGVFAASGIRSLTDIVPGAQLSTDSAGDAVSFGAILGFLAAIFGGWLGGLLAPSNAVSVTAPAAKVIPVDRMDRADSKETPHRRILVPVVGRKGGERSDDKSQDEVHTARVARG